MPAGWLLGSVVGSLDGPWPVAVGPSGVSRPGRSEGAPAQQDGG